jgi:Ion transport protein
MIARNYLKTWFIIDMSSVIPFDQLYQFGNINKISRFTRIGKIYKLIKMMKIVRLIKIVKVNNKLVKNLSEILKISAGTERLTYLIISFFALQHVTACLW